MMEVGEFSSITGQDVPVLVTFVIPGSGDSTPENLSQTVSYTRGYTNITYPTYVYSFGVGYSFSTLYFDNVYYTRFRDTSTASSIITAIA